MHFMVFIVFMFLRHASCSESDLGECFISSVIDVPIHADITPGKNFSADSFTKSLPNCKARRRYLESRLGPDFQMQTKILSSIVPRFRRNSNVVLLSFSIPPQTEQAVFTFVADEIKINSIGGECALNAIEVLLKPRSYPVWNPGNFSMPLDFVMGGWRRQARKEVIQSDGNMSLITLQRPESGDWFVVAYRNWTDPNEDQVGQQGLVAQCTTSLYVDLSTKISNDVQLVDCHKPIELTLKTPATTKTATEDIYKCPIHTNDDTHLVEIKITKPQNFAFRWIIVRMQGRRLPDDVDNMIRCAVDMEDGQPKEFKTRITPYNKEMHYIELSYGSDVSEIAGSKMKPCIDRNDVTNIKTVYELVRIPNRNFFDFIYSLDSSYLSNSPSYVIVQGDKVTSMKFEIQPFKDIGGSLSVSASIDFLSQSDDHLGQYKFFVCLGEGKEQTPTPDGKCEVNGLQYDPVVNITESGKDMKNSSQIPFPENGVWYLTMAIYCQSISASLCKGNVSFSIASTPCLLSQCSPYGTCQYIFQNSLIYSVCLCDGGFSGFDCNDGSNMIPPLRTLTSILLLTLSNLLFIPSIYFALRRRYYTEALVYTFTMFFSTFYHACDAGDGIFYGYCMVPMSILQYSDFFCGVFSFWVTLIAMANLNKTTTSLLHIFGAITIGFAVELDRFSFLIFLVPICVGIVIVLGSWIFRCSLSKRVYPSKRYLIIFLPIGLVMAVTGLVCFAFLQTRSNYYIVHSIWHVLIALSILLCLPIRDYFDTTYLASSNATMITNFSLSTESRNPNVGSQNTIWINQ